LVQYVEKNISLSDAVIIDTAQDAIEKLPIHEYPPVTLKPRPLYKILCC